MAISLESPATSPATMNLYLLSSFLPSLLEGGVLGFAESEFSPRDEEEEEEEEEEDGAEEEEGDCDNNRM